MTINQIIETLGEKHLVIMPITRVLIEDEFNVGDVYFFPVDSIDLETLNPSKNINLDELNEGKYQGDILRELTSSLTQFDISVLRSNYLVAFPFQIDPHRLENLDHQQDISLLKELSESAEKVMDVIRFEYCQLDLPDTLPGQVGSWEKSGDYLGALIFNPKRKVSRLIAGSAVELSIVVKGIGLDLYGCSIMPLIKAEDGELAAIFTHALMLLTDAMSAHNETIKFIRIMTLLEFLGNPYEYMKWQKVKTKIACHIAKDKAQYNSVLDRFRKLTSDKNDKGEEIGLRTLIIHNGKSLPQIITDVEDRKSLFRELQSYVTAILHDIMKNPNSDWDKFEKYREEKMQRLGII